MFTIELSYAYLVLTLPFLVVWICLWLLGSATRHQQFFLSMLGAVAGPTSEILFFTDYWQPESILSYQLWGHTWMLEDVLFGFAIGGIGAVAFSVLTGKKLVAGSHVPYKVRMRYLLGLTLIIFVGSWLLGLNSIYASALACIITALLIIDYRRDLLWPALLNGFFVAAIMFLCYSVLLQVVTNHIAILESVWLLSGGAHDVKLLGVPATELVWGFTWGLLAAVWLPYANKHTYQSR